MRKFSQLCRLETDFESAVNPIFDKMESKFFDDAI
jgi:hypothetical protein